MEELRVYSMKEIANYFVERVNKDIDSTKVEMIQFELDTNSNKDSWQYIFKLTKRPTTNDLKVIKTLVYVYFEQDLIIGDNDLTFSVSGNDGRLRV